MLTHFEMVKTLTKNPQDIIDGMTVKRTNLLHAFIGVGDELGEIRQAITADDEVDVRNLVEELGDARFYLDMLTLQEDMPTFDNNKPLTQTDLGKSVVGEICELQDEAIVKAKRLGIYVKPYEVADLTAFYDRVLALLHYIQFVYHDSIVEEYNLSDDTTHVDVTHLILNQNMDKLLTGKNARYKTGTYSDKQANERADKQ